MWGGAWPLESPPSPPRLVPNYFCTQLPPSDPVWLPRLDSCSAWTSFGEILSGIWFSVSPSALLPGSNQTVVFLFPAMWAVLKTEAIEFTFHVAFASNKVVNVVKFFVLFFIYLFFI